MRIALILLASVLIAAIPFNPPAPTDTYQAKLSGDNEVPPVDTPAGGVAHFRTKRGSDSLKFQVNVNNIEDVVAAHIHMAPADANGPVVAFLFGPDPGTDPNGILVRGTITAADLIGPLAGMPLSELIDRLEAGNAYVNVHTTANPGGEVRGQIR